MSITALQNIRSSDKTNSFVGVFRYIKTSGVKSTKEGELYGFLELSSDGELPAERVANMAWDGVVEGYLYSQSKSVTESLKSAISEFTRRLKDLMRNSKSLEESGIDVNLVVLVTTKEGIYLGNIGENEIFAYKDGKIVNISQVLGKNNAQTAGFHIKPNDLVVISTNSLLTENMHTLVGKSSKEDILKSLELLSKTLLPAQGMFTIFPNIEVEEVLVESIPEKVEEIEEDLVEKKEFNIEHTKVKKDYKVVVKRIFGKIAVFVNGVGKFFGNFFASVGGFFKNIFSKIGNFLTSKLGKKRWFKKYASKISEMRMKKNLPNLKIDAYKTKNLRLQRFKVVILAVLGVFVIVAGYQYTRKQKSLRELHSQADEIFNEIESNLNSAQKKLSTDRSLAQTYVYTASNLFDTVPDGLNEEYESKRVELENEVLGISDELNNRVVVEPESFVAVFDEGTELADIKYLQDSNGNEWLLLTDSGNSAVHLVSVYSRETSQIPDNEGLLKTPKYIDIGKDKDIYVYDSSVGVLKAPISGTGWDKFNTLTGVGIKNIKIDNVKEFGVYADTDNLYYLDSTNGRITKSVNYGSGYSSSTVISVDDSGLIGTNDFFADFSIYALSSGLEGVHRYTAGEPKPLSITGINEELGTLCCGDTSVSQDYGLYVFDSSNRKIVRFEKPKDSYNDKLHPNELLLLKQYLYRGDKDEMWSDVKDIEVDTFEKYIYILDGNTVWRVGL